MNRDETRSQDTENEKMWTKRKNYLFLLSITALMFSILFLSIPIFCVGLLFLFYILLAPPIDPACMDMKRTVDRKVCFIGDKPKMKIDVTNPGIKKIYLEVWDRIPDRMGVGKGTNGGLFSIKPKGEKSIGYSLSTPYRGDFILGPMNANLLDPLGMDVLKAETKGDITTVSVLPHTKDVTNLESKQVVPKVYPGTFLVNQVGSSTQFWSIRDYVKGDAYKVINWKASARKRRLLVNEHEKESTCDVIIVLDGRIVNTVGTASDNPFEFAIRGGAGIASYLISHGNDVGMVVYSSRIAVILPRGGKTQMDSINAYLTKVLPSGNLPMKFAMDVAKAYFPPKSTIIFFTTLMYDPTVVVTIRELVSTGNRVIVVALSSVEFESTMFYAAPTKSRIIDLEFKIILDRIKRMGAKVVSWNRTEPLDVVIDRVNIQ